VSDSSGVLLIASGDVDETMLETLEDYLKRQKKRLVAPKKPSMFANMPKDEGANWGGPIHFSASGRVSPAEVGGVDDNVFVESAEL
jgi:hypothetical protein